MKTSVSPGTSIALSPLSLKVFKGKPFNSKDVVNLMKVNSLWIDQNFEKENYKFIVSEIPEVLDKNYEKIRKIVKSKKTGLILVNTNIQFQKQILFLYENKNCFNKFLDVIKEFPDVLSKGIFTIVNIQPLKNIKPNEEQGIISKMKNSIEKFAYVRLPENNYDALMTYASKMNYPMVICGKNFFKWIEKEGSIQDKKKLLARNSIIIII